MTDRANLKLRASLLVLGALIERANAELDFLVAADWLGASDEHHQRERELLVAVARAAWSVARGIVKQEVVPEHHRALDAALAKLHEFDPALCDPDFEVKP